MHRKPVSLNFNMYLRLYCHVQLGHHWSENCNFPDFQGQKEPFINEFVNTCTPNSFVARPRGTTIIFEDTLGFFYLQSSTEFM